MLSISKDGIKIILKQPRYYTEEVLTGYIPSFHISTYLFGSYITPIRGL